VTIRSTTRKLLEKCLRRRLRPFEPADWAASAVIFAPHPDDETLGCGGVASKKIAAGVELHFVFITDGAASHSGRVAPELLRRQRTCEAVEAVRRLGGTIDQVTFLNVPDGKAADHVERIVESVALLLLSWRPQSIFVVHAADPSPDHLAVNASVLRAARACGRPMTVYEYPVWYWYHWPWVRLAGDLPGMWQRSLRQSIAMLAGLRGLSMLNSRADIADALEVKRDALAAHRSQTARPPGQADWPILSDLAGGDFVNRLFADYEAFMRYELNS
jgi:LmbE family N-acetylglucosaminyl deacetylase